MFKLLKENRRGLRVWVEIDTKAAEHNFKTLKKLLSPGAKFASVTKSNAYGHDLIEYSKLQEKFGADWICVDSIMEAKALREAGIKIPVLVMGYALPENFSMANQIGCSLTVSTFENLKVITQTTKTTKTRHLGVRLPSGGGGVKIHLKFDTGMSRQGFLKKDLKKILKIIEGRTVIVEGVYTHFAKAKVPKERMETDKQLAEFKKIAGEFKERGYKPLLHAGATSAGIVYPESHFDMVRFGIGIYGLWPERAVKEAFEDKLTLKPVLSWKSLVSEVKKLPKGRGVGYDLTHILKKDSVVAVVPVGYWHGYLRVLSNKSSVLIKGRRAPLLGRVSMGMIVVDVTGIEGVKPEDEVVLIGKQGDPKAPKGARVKKDPKASLDARVKEITAEELADLAGTINYEIVTGINPLSKRIYINK